VCQSCPIPNPNPDPDPDPNCVLELRVEPSSGARHVTILDRSKNLFKLAQGEYVSPERLEGTFELSPLVRQAFAHGDSLQPCVVVVIVPNEKQLSARCRQAAATAAASKPAATAEGSAEDDREVELLRELSTRASEAG